MAAANVAVRHVNQSAHGGDGGDARMSNDASGNQGGGHKNKGGDRRADQVNAQGAGDVGNKTTCCGIICCACLNGPDNRLAHQEALGQRQEGDYIEFDDDNARANDFGSHSLRGGGAEDQDLHPEANGGLEQTAKNDIKASCIVA